MRIMVVISHHTNSLEKAVRTAVCLFTRSLVPGLPLDNLVNLSVACVCGVEMCSSVDEEQLK